MGIQSKQEVEGLSLLQFDLSYCVDLGRFPPGIKTTRRRISAYRNRIFNVSFLAMNPKARRSQPGGDG
jgi:hypothetical protein